jgi:hypothetical protein
MLQTFFEMLGEAYLCTHVFFARRSLGLFERRLDHRDVLIEANSMPRKLELR